MAASSERDRRAVFSGIVVVIFSMVGAEIATIAAAESATRPGRSPGPPIR